MANTLVGFFDDWNVAQGAVDDLVAAGIDRSSISVVANDGNGDVTTRTFDADGNLAAEGAASGATSGAVVGGLAGLLIGAGFAVLPFAGILLAGPIAGLLAGAATGAVTGGVVGGLIGMGIPEEHAELYAEGVRRGGTLVTVSADGFDEAKIRDVFNRDGAVDIQSRGADWRANGFTGYDANAKPYTNAEIADERARYATPVNSDWNDTAFAPAPSSDATYAGKDFAAGSTYGTDARGDFNQFDQDYRTFHANWNPGEDYDAYAPAYSFGRDLANDSTFNGDWDTNEIRFRDRWEARQPGTWDKFKASVRNAYDDAKNAVTGGRDGNRATLY